MAVLHVSPPPETGTCSGGHVEQGLRILLCALRHFRKELGLEKTVLLCQTPSEAHETVGQITRGHVTDYHSLELGGGGRSLPPPQCVVWSRPALARHAKLRHDTRDAVRRRRRVIPVCGLELRHQLSWIFTPRKWQDTRWKTCCGTATVPRSQQCFPNLDLRTSHHKAHRDRVEPVGIHHIVEDWRVLWKTGRRLQLIPAGLPRDHMPILLTLRYTLQASTARAGIRWDLQAIEDCLQKGNKRVAFLQAVDSISEKAKSRFDMLRENPTAEGTCSTFLQPSPNKSDCRHCVA